MKLNSSLRRQTFLAGIILGSLLLLADCPAEAILPPDPVVGMVLQSLVTHSFPSAPMSRHCSEMKIVPAYFDFSGNYTEDRFGRHEVNRESGSGWGGAVSYTFGFNSHWGISALAGGAAQSGQTASEEGLTVSPIEGWNGATSEADFESSDQVVSFNLVYDPLGSSKRVRLPIFAGFSYEWISLDSDPLNFQYTTPPSAFATADRLARVGHSGSAAFSSSQNGAGITAGIAPKLNAGSFNISPFGFFYMPFSDEHQEVTVQDISTGEKFTTKFTHTPEDTLGFGMDLMFVPWNLSFRYIPLIRTEPKSHVYSFAWSKHWGN